MASGTLDADKIRKDKSKWGEFNKVYTRRRKQLANNAATLAVATAAVESPAAGSPVTTGNNEQTLENPDGNYENTLRNEDPEPSGQSQRDEPVVDVGNGVAATRPIATVVDDRVRICLEASTSKSEIIELREKLISELGQVRGLVQKLEDKEAEITQYSDVRDVNDNDEGYTQLPYHSGNVAVDGNDEGYAPLQYHSGNVAVDGNNEGYTQLSYHSSGNVAVDGNGRSLVRVNSEMGTEYMDRRGLTRVHSEVGSDVIDRRALTRVQSEMSPFVTQDMSRFRQLSVSVGEYVEKEKRTPKANQHYRNSDFLLSKDRLPPESNKKQKSNGGRKSEYSSSFERHRNQVFRSCSSLLQRLMKHKHGWVFNEPVNAKLLGLHDYHDIIKHPMDLGTVKSRLAQNFYKTPGEFADDVRLTFHNAMTYNPRGQDVHVMAEQLSDIFEERWVVIESDWNYGPVHQTPVARNVNNNNNPRTLDRSQSMGLPFMARPKPPSFAPVRTPVPKKPKARDPNKRDMTIEEKQKLSANLQSLPSEKLDSIVQIINKSNTSLSQNDDEIEVDIDSVDAETLWELDRFVTNYKKNLSKHKRKAEKARALANNNNRAMLPNPVPSSTIPEVLPEKRADEQNPVASQPNQGGNNNMSSSSSSSSDSGSSSSDSDSDSSSADGSGQ